MAFTPQDFADVGALALEAWTAGIDRDWSARAGTLDWSCRRTAEHTVDAVLAPAVFLASRRTEDYPPIKDLEIDEAATTSDLVDCLRAVVNVVYAVLVTTDPDARAIIRRSPVETAAPGEFAPRCGLELILHTHDICSGLAVPFDPPPGHCERLLERGAAWLAPSGAAPTDDPWSDLLALSGRPRPAQGGGSR